MDKNITNMTVEELKQRLDRLENNIWLENMADNRNTSLIRTWELEIRAIKEAIERAESK